MHYESDAVEFNKSKKRAFTAFRNIISGKSEEIDALMAKNGSLRSSLTRRHSRTRRLMRVVDDKNREIDMINQALSDGETGLFPTKSMEIQARVEEYQQICGEMEEKDLIISRKERRGYLFATGRLTTKNRPIQIKDKQISELKNIETGHKRKISELESLNTTTNALFEEYKKKYAGAVNSGAAHPTRQTPSMPQQNVNSFDKLYGQQRPQLTPQLAQNAPQRPQQPYQGQGYQAQQRYPVRPQQQPAPQQRPIQQPQQMPPRPQQGMPQGQRPNPYVQVGYPSGVPQRGDMNPHSTAFRIRGLQSEITMSSEAHRSGFAFACFNKKDLRYTQAFCFIRLFQKMVLDVANVKLYRKGILHKRVCDG